MPNPTNKLYAGINWLLPISINRSILKNSGERSPPCLVIKRVYFALMRLPHQLEKGYKQ